MKRKTSYVRSPPAKRQHIERSDTQVLVEAAITNTKSVREQAEPYCLYTAKLLLEALMPS